VMSLQQTTRPLEQATIRSRVSPISPTIAVQDHLSEILLRSIRPKRARRPSDASVDQTYARWPDLVRWQFVETVFGGFLGTLLGFGKISGFDLRSIALAVGGGLVVLLFYGLTKVAPGLTKID